MGMLTCLVILALASSPASVVNSSRVKRLLYGTPLFDYKSYRVIAYNVHISKGFGMSFNWGNIYKLVSGSVPSPSTNSLICGGSLVTLQIVQTACHCLSTWRPVNRTYGRASIDNGFENFLVIFAGWTMVHEMGLEDGAFLKVPIIHEKCGKVVQHATYDYGLILLDRPVQLRLPHMKVAPRYKSRTILKLYWRTMQKQFICLFIGFGIHYYENRKKGILGFPAPVLQHGWRRITDYDECREHSSFTAEYAPYKYQDVANWFCSVYFGKHRATPIRGDSGGPVTCRDYRIGLISHSTRHPSPVSVSWVAATAFALEYNAAEYVQALEEEATLYLIDNSDWRPTQQYEISTLKQTVGPITPVPFPFIRKRFSLISKNVCSSFEIPSIFLAVLSLSALSQ